MLKEDCILKFDLLKIILSNPANKISEIDADDVSKKLSLFIQEVRKRETLPQQEGKPLY